MSKTSLEWIECPWCKKGQQEPSGVVSTNCRSCGHHISVRGVQYRKIILRSQPKKEVFCPSCQLFHRVAETSISTICPHCNYHINMQDYEVISGSNEKITTTGTVSFRSGASYKGCEVRATRIVIGCKVSARLIAQEEAILTRRGQIDGKLEAPVIRVSPGAFTRAYRLITPHLEIEGELQTHSVRTNRLIIHPDGYLDANKIICSEVIVHPGGILRGSLQTVNYETPV